MIERIDRLADLRLEDVKRGFMGFPGGQGNGNKGEWEMGSLSAGYGRGLMSFWLC
jgi:hypothetical protein